MTPVPSARTSRSTWKGSAMLETLSVELSVEQTQTVLFAPVLFSEHSHQHKIKPSHLTSPIQFFTIKVSVRLFFQYIQSYSTLDLFF